MVYSTAERLASRSPRPGASTADGRCCWWTGKRVMVGEAAATLGRSRDCEIVLADPNVSRRHAELRPAGGTWVVEDLGSTNGVKVNGGASTAAPR